MSFNKSWLLVNCVRPKEPSFTPKCNHQYYLDLPDDYFTERYRAIGHDLEEKYAHETQVRIPVPRIHLPDLSFVDVKRRGMFSPFVPRHREMAGNLITMFMQSESVGELMALGAYMKDRLNPYMFQYVYQVALKHHPLSKDLPLPSIVEQFPEQFMDPVAFPLLQEETSIMAPDDRRIVELPTNFTASDLEDEQRLAYFREDIGVNMHHWHWHLVYPLEGPLEIVDKDRRGELFYYMHGQLVARYESERLSNGMARVVVYDNFREPVKEGYYSKLMRNTNMRPFAGRPPNTTLKDLNRPDAGIVVTIATFEGWLDQILLAIDQGFVIDTNGRRISLDNDQGIDILGNIVEASSLSVNQPLYGDWHNTGHDIFAYATDPDGRYLEDIGPMGDVTTAMRDPVFYRFHKHVDNVFERHKRLLPQYNRQQLSYDPININSVMCRIPKDNAAPNVLLTFWQRSQIDLSGGLDFQADGAAFVSFTHLQHADFDYVLDVSNNSSQTLMGTCRIFLAPNCDDTCHELFFNDQRKLMVELDKFTVSCKYPQTQSVELTLTLFSMSSVTPGDNRIIRPSLNSSVTISWEKSFQAIGKLTQLNPNASPQELADLEFCGCGWPHHLLLPKGSEDGAAFKLFVMISNFDDDVVNQVIPE